MKGERNERRDMHIACRHMQQCLVAVVVLRAGSRRRPSNTEGFRGGRGQGAARGASHIAEGDANIFSRKRNF